MYGLHLLLLRPPTKNVFNFKLIIKQISDLIGPINLKSDSWSRSARVCIQWQRVEWQLKLNMRRAAQLAVHGDRGDTRAEAEDAQESAACFSRWKVPHPRIRFFYSQEYLLSRQIPSNGRGGHPPLNRLQLDSFFWISLRLWKKWLGHYSVESQQGIPPILLHRSLHVRP